MWLLGFVIDPTLLTCLAEDQGSNSVRTVPNTIAAASTQKPFNALDIEKHLLATHGYYMHYGKNQLRWLLNLSFLKRETLSGEMLSKYFKIRVIILSIMTFR